MATGSKRRRERPYVHQRFIRPGVAPHATTKGGKPDMDLVSTNFVRVPQTLKTPAAKAGITDREWKIEDMVD